MKRWWILLIIANVSILILLGSTYANLQIQSNLDNAIQTIKKIFITSDGLSANGSNDLIRLNEDNNGSVYIKGTTQIDDFLQLPNINTTTNIQEVLWVTTSGVVYATNFSGLANLISPYITSGSGQQGATGAQWPQGIQGATWATGAQWPQGIQGVAWPAGAQWPKGIQGIAWPAGAQWPQGIQGATWATGISISGSFITDDFLYFTLSNNTTINAGILPYIQNPWTISGTNVFTTGYKVGIGTNNPTTELEINWKTQFLGDVSLPNIHTSGDLWFILWLTSTGIVQAQDISNIQEWQRKKTIYTGYTNIYTDEYFVSIGMKTLVGGETDFPQYRLVVSWAAFIDYALIFTGYINNLTIYDTQDSQKDVSISTTQGTYSWQNGISIYNAYEPEKYSMILAWPILSTYNNNFTTNGWALNQAWTAYRLLINKNDQGSLIMSNSGQYWWSSEYNLSYNADIDTAIKRRNAGHIMVTNGDWDLADISTDQSQIGTTEQKTGIKLYVLGDTYLQGNLIVGNNNDINTSSSNAIVWWENNNINNATYSSILGGVGNNINNAAHVAILWGENNIITNVIYWSILGWVGNIVDANYAFAIWVGAHATHTWSFVIADSNWGTIQSTSENQLTIRAAGGTRIFSDSIASQGVELTAGGSSWISVSDKNRKENIQKIDFEHILSRFQQLPIMKRNYIGSDIKLYGTFAQDFNTLFPEIGDHDLGLSTQEIDGITMAAIKWLINRTNQLQIENTILKEQINEIKAMLE